MISFIPVSNLVASNDELRQIYINSFTSDERREWHQLMELLPHPFFQLKKVLENQQQIGLIALWNLPGFIFIEHFAIEANFQDKGLGTKVLKQLLEEKSWRVVLEVEPANDETASRRITFYERLGFSVCEGIYWQPPYSADKQKVKMHLMSYPDQIQPLEFDQIKRHIHREVYQLDDSLNF